MPNCSICGDEGRIQFVGGNYCAKHAEKAHSIHQRLQQEIERRQQLLKAKPYIDRLCNVNLKIV